MNTRENEVITKLPPFRENSGLGIDHCEKYSDSSTCEFCINGFYLKEKKCETITSSVNNCKYYLDQNQCIECKDGYFLYSNKCSEFQVHNCDEYESASKCITCSDTHPVLINGDCSRPEGISLKCLKFLKTSDDEFICEECEEYYYPNELGDCDPINFPIEKCIKYDSPTKCKICEQGNYFNKKLNSCEEILDFE